MKKSLAVVAIDGAGTQTSDYLALLRSSIRYSGAESAILCTSDPDARDAVVQCRAIPKLDYLAYSRFCVEQLVHFVHTDYALCVQLDGFVLNPSQWRPEFLDFDYVGAPWRNKRTRPIDQAQSVGNGGFSLRSRRFLEASSGLTWHGDWSHTALPKKYWGNEDYLLCVLERTRLESRGVRFAPVELAAQFSIQAGDQLHRSHRLHSVFGFHGKKLMGKARRHTELHGLDYPHLAHVRRTFLPLFY